MHVCVYACMRELLDGISIHVCICKAPACTVHPRFCIYVHVYYKHICIFAHVHKFFYTHAHAHACIHTAVRGYWEAHIHREQSCTNSTLNSFSLFNRSTMNIYNQVVSCRPTSRTTSCTQAWLVVATIVILYIVIYRYFPSVTG